MALATDSPLPSGQCYVCGEPTAPRRIGTNDLDVCRTCGFGRVAAIAPVDDYWARSEDAEHELAERYWQARTGVFRRALAQVGGSRGPGRVVDLGGGVGYFAACAIEEGWDAFSVDVSEHAVQAAAARIGSDRSMARAPADLEGTCDLVTLWCVVAHVPDPRAVVADALRLLKPEGRLLVTTPNFLFQARYASVTARLGRPLDFVASDHLLHFTPAAMDRLLTGAGATRRSFSYWGITEDCLLERRLATLLVPAKRAWNWGAWQVSRAGTPLLTSELQVEAVRARE
ncbi:MAG: class I SAM-dependent methyltransferase [Acidimicrobiia bacterium]